MIDGVSVADSAFSFLFFGPLLVRGAAIGLGTIAVVLFGLLLGYLPVAAVFSAGPLAVVCSGLAVACALSCVVAYCLRRTVYGMSWSLVLIAWTITFMPAAYTLYTAPTTAQKIRSVTPRVTEFALSKFSLIDTDRNEVIDEDELKRPADEYWTYALPAQQRRLWEYMQENYSEIGYPLEGKLGDEFTDDFYGITKDDLRAYPERASAEYKNW